MGVLVGVGHLRLGIHPGIGDDHHALLLVVIEADDLAGQQLQLERSEILVGGEQSQRAQRDVVGTLPGLGVVLLEACLQLGLELARGR